MGTRLVLTLAGALVASAALQLRGVQGMDDQTMTDFSRGMSDNGLTLGLRYATIDAELQPGLRRYNAFWSGAEDGSAPSISPLACDSTHIPVPANESDRVARGYNHFHCYNAAFLEAFDDELTRDAAIGAASAFIMYGSPAYAQDPACTGFPWGPDMYKSGCLPWNALDDWEDYCNLVSERWAAPWGSGKARLSGMVIWNEVQSMGWADPSPVLPNRWNGTAWTSGQYAAFAGIVANLTLLAGRAAARHTVGEPMTLWLSTDHFSTAPALHNGDVGHIGLNDLLAYMWPLVNTTVPWSIAVHPYDAGDPRANLTGHGVYTFASLRESVAEVQCDNLVTYAGVARDSCWEWPQVNMWASEQGWPYNNVTMNKTMQARNICYAHGLSVAQGVWAVSHNFFQGSAPSSQGYAGDFSLVDEPPVCYANLTTCGSMSETYRAYQATAPGVYGLSDGHYCCTRWGWGCVGDSRSLELLANGADQPSSDIAVLEGAATPRASSVFLFERA